MLADAGASVLGIDVSAEAIAYAATAYPGDGLRGSLQYAVGSVEDYSAPVAEPFDIVVCFEGIAHVDEDVGRLGIRRFAATTRLSSTLFVSSPNPYASKSQVGPDKFHRREYSPRELADLVDADGTWTVVAAWSQSHGEDRVRQATKLSDLDAWKDQVQIRDVTLKAVRI